MAEPLQIEQEIPDVAGFGRSLRVGWAAGASGAQIHLDRPMMRDVARAIEAAGQVQVITVEVPRPLGWMDALVWAWVLTAWASEFFTGPASLIAAYLRGFLHG